MAKAHATAVQQAKEKREVDNAAVAAGNHVAVIHPDEQHIRKPAAGAPTLLPLLAAAAAVVTGRGGRRRIGR